MLGELGRSSRLRGTGRLSDVGRDSRSKQGLDLLGPIMGVGRRSCSNTRKSESDRWGSVTGSRQDKWAIVSCFYYSTVWSINRT